jgi:hypothetical protein
MDCPVCGSDQRQPLGHSRYRCVAPVRSIRTTAPPDVGTNWGPVPLGDTVVEQCDAVYRDTEEWDHHRRSHLHPERERRPSR